MLYNKCHTLKLIHNLVCVDCRHGETSTETVKNMPVRPSKADLGVQNLAFEDIAAPDQTLKGVGVGG